MKTNKSIIIKPPQKIPPKKKGQNFLFLAGSIEMGTAENWQEQVEQKLINSNWTILNPRRDHWDSTLEQSIKNETFRKQVEWEQAGLEIADKILVYFSPGTKSPITLLEVGLNAKSRKLVICCPNGFWRKGNIEIICNKYDIPLFENLDDAIKKL